MKQSAVLGRLCGVERRRARKIGEARLRAPSLPANSPRSDPWSMHDCLSLQTVPLSLLFWGRAEMHVDYNCPFCSLLLPYSVEVDIFLRHGITLPS